MESQDANYHILILLLGHAKTVPFKQLLNIADITTIGQHRLCQSLVLFICGRVGHRPMTNPSEKFIRLCLKANHHVEEIN